MRPSDAVSWLAPLAYAQLTVAAPAATVLSDYQILLAAASAGLISGVFMTFNGEDPVETRNLVRRLLGSSVVAPGLVSGAFIYWSFPPHLYYVVGVSVVAGSIAYPVADALPRFASTIIKVVGAKLKSLTHAVLDKFFGPSDPKDGP